ncbi:hypothetical protein NHQ30_009238 [Ciborinia camelliae]|nr:hypothetical protein NHQ30_009238 [Ciborinia camelliae]
MPQFHNPQIAIPILSFGLGLGLATTIACRLILHRVSSTNDTSSHIHTSTEKSEGNENSTDTLRPNSPGAQTQRLIADNDLGCQTKIEEARALIRESDRLAGRITGNFSSDSDNESTAPPIHDTKAPCTCPMPFDDDMLNPLKEIHSIPMPKTEDEILNDCLAAERATYREGFLSDFAHIPCGILREVYGDFGDVNEEADGAEIVRGEEEERDERGGRVFEYADGRPIVAPANLNSIAAHASDQIS